MRMKRPSRQMAAIEEGRNLKRLRLERGWKPKEAAEKLGTNIKYLYQMESGARGIGADLLSRILRVFNITEDEIVVKNHQQDADDQILAAAIETIRAAAEWPREKKAELLLELERVAARLQREEK